MIQGHCIGLVGHCGPDAAMLRNLIGRVAPDVPVVNVNDAASLDDLARAGRLLLVNRVLCGSFAHESGIEMIRELSARESAPVSMLISNYEESQRQAEQAGAAPGFGKSELYLGSTSARLLAALERAAAAVSDVGASPAR
jgi:hypothetical protein